MMRYVILFMILLVPSLAIAQGKITRYQDTHTIPHKSMPTKGIENGHEWVDLGLPSGVLWATSNIGSDRESDCGTFFSWGCLATPKDNIYSIENTPTYDKDIKEYSGNPEYDAACVLWGGNWRVPTKSDYAELVKHTICSIANVNGITGFKLTGKNGNNIFVPYTPIKVGTTTCDDPQYRVVLWLSTPFSSRLGNTITANEKGFVIPYSTGKQSGHPIRPVMNR